MSITIKAIVLGARAVGKTTLISHLHNRFSTDLYIPTIGVDTTSYSRSGLTLQIWDTSSSSKYTHIVRCFVRDASLAIVVYNSKATFDKAKNYIAMYRELSERDQRIALVSLATDPLLSPLARFYAQVERIEYFECSALDRAQSLSTWHHLIDYCVHEVRVHKWKTHPGASTNIAVVPRRRFCWLWW
mgnify:CR=1 FL=1